MFFLLSLINASVNRSTDDRIGHRIGPIFGNIGKTSDRQNLTVLTDTCTDVWFDEQLCNNFF